MNDTKRLFDLIVGGVLAVFLTPVLLVLMGIVLLREGRPVFHVSERMHRPDAVFRMWKIRTMAQVGRSDGVTGGHSLNRITVTGRWLRKRRLDELLQLWNVLRGCGATATFAVLRGTVSGAVRRSIAGQTGDDWIGNVKVCAS